MIVYCVVAVTEFYDNGKVKAWITNHVANDGKLPQSSTTVYKNKAIYRNYFADKSEAVKFCDEAKKIRLTDFGGLCN